MRGDCPWNALPIGRRCRLSWQVCSAVTLMPVTAWANASKVVQPAIVSANPANFTPNVLDGKINALVEVGDLIIAGGLFSQVQESGSGKPVLTRSNIVAFNATTGVVVAGFTPNVDGEIKALTLAGDRQSVYVGGSFRNVNGQARNRLARIQIADGTLTPGFAAASFNSRVNDLALRGDQLLVAGIFSYVGTSRRIGVASLNAGTGALTTYLRADLATTRTGIPQVLKFDVTPSGSTMFAIGNFTSINAVPRSQIAKFDLGPSAATLADWSTDFYTSICASCSIPTCAIWTSARTAPIWSSRRRVPTMRLRRRVTRGLVSRWDPQVLG